MTGTGSELSRAEISAGLRRAATRLVEMRDLLNSLDAAMGDGDCGLTAEKGAGGVLAYLDANAPGEDPGQFDLGKWLAGAGMAYNRAAPSTMGALMATALMRAGKVVMGQSSITSTQLAQMLTAANQGLQERGKTKPGDKTIVDALHPAAEAFSRGIQSGASLEDAARQMLQAARAGRDAAISLRSQVGRANWVGERTENQPDPGTVLFVGALEAVLGADTSEAGSTLK